MEKPWSLADDLFEEQRRMNMRLNAPVPGRMYTMKEAQEICERADQILKSKRKET